MFGVQSPYVAGELTPHASLLVDYARDPLVLKSLGRDRIGAVVSDQLFLHVNAGFAIKRRVMVNVVFPVALMQDGDNPSQGRVQFTSPNAAAVGDMRFGARVALIGTYWDPFQLAVGGYVWIPTGDSTEGSFVGQGARGLPQVIAGGRLQERLVWSFDLGPEVRRTVLFGGQNGVGQGTTLRTGMGVGLLLGKERNFQIGPEFSAGFVLDDPNNTPATRSTNLEAMLDARYRFWENFEAGLGVGTGLSSGLGTPQMRLVGMISYTPRVTMTTMTTTKPEPPQPKDTDGDGILDDPDACEDVKGVQSTDPAKNGCPPDADDDGILDAKDACVDVPGVASDEPAKNGCPLDSDDDGIIDADDACVQVKGVAHPDKAKNGCPPDQDEDGVIDAEDACVDIKGLKTDDPATNGCPGDTDGDTIRDDADACPNEKGKPDEDPTKHGCPVAVRVTETEVVILQQVQFDTGKATIKRASDPLLDELASVLKDHLEITKIEVQGHTDNRGSAARNKTLSQARAESVLKALVSRGVVAERFVAKGYGPDKPIGDNRNDEGRQQNRRVQFMILEKVPRSLVSATTSTTIGPEKPQEAVPAKLAEAVPAKPDTTLAKPAAVPNGPAPAKAPAPMKKGRGSVNAFDNLFNNVRSWGNS